MSPYRRTPHVLYLVALGAAMACSGCIDPVRAPANEALLPGPTCTGASARSGDGISSVIELHNEMSASFRLNHVVFLIDGRGACRNDDPSGELWTQRDIRVFDAPLPAGDHTCQLELGFHGHGQGSSDYLRGYRFTIKSSHAFTAAPGKAFTETVRVYEEGTEATPLEQRPKIAWRDGDPALPQ